MKLIAHRGNIDGSNLNKENDPEYIDFAIKMGYDVEIDVRLENHYLYLGHDLPQYQVSMLWLNQRRENLWIHCKNLNALRLFSDSPIDFNYFWHQEDDFALTSQKYIWTYPGKPYTHKSVIVMPEWEVQLENFDSLKDCECYGICSDYVGRLV